jgi:hypothetical protein
MAAIVAVWYLGAATQVSAQVGFTPMLMTPRMNCGPIDDGANAVRYMYAASTVSDPSTCTVETQTATCNNGTLSAYSGTYANSSCTASRVRYSTSSASCPTPCAAETQSRVCTAGSCGAWSGTYTNASCAQNSSTQSMSIWKKTTTTSNYNCNPYQCNPYSCNCMFLFCQTCYNTCYQTCTSTSTSCGANGTAQRTCSATTNTVAGTWGAWSPNASDLFTNNTCTTRY